MKISEFLKQVRARMSPETWIKGSLAKGKDGRYTDYTSGDACSFCLYGYLYHTDYSLVREGKEGCEVQISEDLAQMIVAANPQVIAYPLITNHLVVYNDDPNTTFEDIVKVIDNSIQYAEVKDL